jgi:hypothetical protein
MYSPYGQKRLRDAVFGLGKDLGEKVSVNELSSRHLQDFALGLDFIIEVPNLDSVLLYGVDVTSNKGEMQNKRMHQTQCRRTYNQLSIGPTSVAYLNPGDRGWSALSPKDRSTLKGKFFDLLLELGDSEGSPIEFDFHK